MIFTHYCYLLQLSWNTEIFITVSWYQLRTELTKRRENNVYCFRYAQRKSLERV